MLENDKSSINKNNVLIYPNPAENVINIKGVNIGSMIEIYNPIGKLIISTIVNNNELSIDVGNYTSGSYIMKIISIDNELIEKFILK